VRKKTAARVGRPGASWTHGAPMSDAQRVIGWDCSPRLRTDDKQAQRPSRYTPRSDRIQMRTRSRWLSSLLRFAYLAK
jgi:hypothetical protein